MTLDAAVYKWYKQESAASISVRGVDVMNAAKHLKNLNANSGTKLCSQYCLNTRKEVDESVSANLELLSNM